MTQAIENTGTQTPFLFDDKSAMETFVKRGWLGKVAGGKAKGVPCH